MVSDTKRKTKEIEEKEYLKERTKKKKEIKDVFSLSFLFVF